VAEVSLTVAPGTVVVGAAVVEVVEEVVDVVEVVELVEVVLDVVDDVVEDVVLEVVEEVVDDVVDDVVDEVVEEVVVAGAATTSIVATSSMPSPTGTQSVITTSGCEASTRVPVREIFTCDPAAAVVSKEKGNSGVTVRTTGPSAGLAGIVSSFGSDSNSIVAGSPPSTARSIANFTQPGERVIGPLARPGSSFTVPSTVPPTSTSLGTVMCAVTPRELGTTPLPKGVPSPFRRAQLKSDTPVWVVGVESTVSDPPISDTTFVEMCGAVWPSSGTQEKPVSPTTRTNLETLKLIVEPAPTVGVASMIPCPAE
jgi:hypothetical protein